jgi:hypothetical protein
MRVSGQSEARAAAEKLLRGDAILQMLEDAAQMQDDYFRWVSDEVAEKCAKKLRGEDQSMRRRCGFPSNGEGQTSRGPTTRASPAIWYRHCGAPRAERDLPRLSMAVRCAQKRS